MSLWVLIALQECNAYVSLLRKENDVIVMFLAGRLCLEAWENNPTMNMYHYDHTPQHSAPHSTGSTPEQKNTNKRKQQQQQQQQQIIIGKELISDVEFPKKERRKEDLVTKLVYCSCWKWEEHFH